MKDSFRGITAIQALASTDGFQPIRQHPNEPTGARPSTTKSLLSWSI
jgi:hypothetical protein